MPMSMFGHCKSDSSIPIEQLDYDFIEHCKDTTKLGKILQILRSGDEGYYPDLVDFAEKRLQKLKPDCHLLEKKNIEQMTKDLEKAVQENLTNEINDFVASNSKDVTVTNGTDDLPPVRSAKNININSTNTDITSDENKKMRNDAKVNKSVKPKSYEEWAKIEKEIEKDGDDEQVSSNPVDKTLLNTKPKIHDLIGKDNEISDKWKSSSLEEQKIAAENEKNKGNEAFRCGDYSEALVYYNRSLSIYHQPSVLNNRAITYIKLEKYKEALDDANSVIQKEPSNMKAYLRRGISYHSLGKLEDALKDFTRVVELEPKNRRGKELYEKVFKEIEKRDGNKKKKGKRLIVEEIDSTEMKEQNIDNKMNDTSKIKEIKDNKSDIANIQEKNSEKDNIEKDADNCVSSKDTNKAEIAANNESKKGKRIQIIETNSNQDEKNTSLQNNGIDQSETSSSTMQSYNSLQNVKKSDTSSTLTNGLSNILPPNDEKSNTATNIPSHTSSFKTSSDNIATNIDNTSQKYTENPKMTASNEIIENSNSKIGKNISNIVKELPEDVVNKQKEGNVSFKQGAYPEALEKYTTAIHMLMDEQPGHDRNLAALFNNRAVCSLKIGDCYACIKDASKSLQFSPNPKAYLRRAKAYEALEKYGDAYLDFQSVLKFNNGDITASQGCSRLSAQLKSDLGVNWREKISQNNKASNIRKEVSHDEQSPPQKTHMLEKNETINDRSVKATKGITVKDQEKSQNKTKYSDTSKDQGNNYGKLKEREYSELKEKGNKCFQQGKYAEAILSYTQCILLFPEETASYTNRALSYLKMNEANKAIEDCNKALTLQPNNIKAFFRRSQAKKAIKDYKAALKDLTMVLKIEPNNTAAKKDMDVCKELYRQELCSIQNKMHAPKKNETSKKVKIEEISTSKKPPKSANKSSSKINPCPTAKYATETNKTKLKKTTAFEFMQRLTSIKSNKSESYAEILKQIDPAKLPELISNKLDADILINIIQSIHDHFTDSSSNGSGIRLLKNLTKVSRFNTVTLMLCAKDKQLFKTTLLKLEAKRNENCDEEILKDLDLLKGIKL